MAASRNDSNVLGANPLYVNRVQSSLVAAAINIFAEGFGASTAHRERVQFVHQILSSPTSITNYTTMFAVATATDASVLADATAAGTVVLSSGNVAAQQASITDAHIDAAVAAMFNAFVPGIST